MMLLEKDDGTYRLFINEKKLKNKEQLPSFESCLAYIEKKPLGTTKVESKFDKSGCFLAFSVVILVIGGIAIFIGFMLSGLWGLDAFFYNIGVPALLISPILLAVSQQKK